MTQASVQKPTLVAPASSKPDIRLYELMDQMRSGADTPVLMDFHTHLLRRGSALKATWTPPSKTILGTAYYYPDTPLPERFTDGEFILDVPKDCIGRENLLFGYEYFARVQFNPNHVIYVAQGVTVLSGNFPKENGIYLIDEFGLPTKGRSGKEDDNTVQLYRRNLCISAPARGDGIGNGLIRRHEALCMFFSASDMLAMGEYAQNGHPDGFLI